MKAGHYFILGPYPERKFHRLPDPVLCTLSLGTEHHVINVRLASIPDPRNKPEDDDHFGSGHVTWVYVCDPNAV